MKKYYLIAFLFFIFANSGYSQIWISGGPINWNTNQTITDDVIITSGATLVITATISMAADKKIVVMQGGRLEVISGTIKKTTENWKGIFVEGSPSNNQPSYGPAWTGNYGGANGTVGHQGVLKLLNCTIKEADNPITVGQGFTGITTPAGGGVVLAKHSLIEGRYNLVSFIDEYFSNNLIDNTSRFDNCVFGRNGNFGCWNCDDIYYHLLLRRVNGVKVRNCTFESLNYSNKRNGIGVFGASVDVQNSNFQGLYTAITVFNWFFNTGRPNVVKNNNFQFALHSYINIGSDLDQVVLNDFRLIHGSHQSAGVGYLGSNGLIVEQNEFQSSTGSGHIESVGIVSQSLGPLGDEIYNNKFTGLNNGIQSFRDNLGLQYRCNELSNIERYNINVASAPGVGDQGLCIPLFNIFRLPMNTFSNDCNVSSGDFNASSQISSIVYNDAVNFLPICKSSNIVSNSCNVQLEIADCPNNFTNWGDIFEFPYQTVTMHEENMQGFGLNINANFDNTNYSPELYEDNPDEELRTTRFLLAERNIAYQRLVSLLTDSLGIHDAINYLLDQDNEDALRIALPLLITAEMYTEARAIVDALPSNITFFDDMKSWYEFILDKREVDSLEYENVQLNDSLFISQMANTPGIMQGKAKALYYFLYGMPYPHIEGLFGHPTNKRFVQSQPKIVKDVNVFPNPAKDNFYIDVDFEETITNATVELQSTMGLNILSESVKTNGKHRFHLRADDVPAGIYLLILQSDKGEREVRKIIIH